MKLNSSTDSHSAEPKVLDRKFFMCQYAIKHKVNGGNMNIDDLRRYYETYMVPNAKNIDEWTAAFPGAVVSVSTVRKVFERIAATMLPCLILTVNCILAFIKH